MGESPFTADDDRRNGFALFAALCLPPPIATEVGLLNDEIGPSSYRVANEHLHITLAGIIGLARRPPDDLIRVLRMIMASVHAVAPEIALCRAATFKSWVSLLPSCTIQIRALRRAILDALRHAGWEIEDGHFRPHVSLRYGVQMRFTAAVPPIRWTASSFQLVCSHRGRRHHELLGSWPLIEQLRLL